MLDIGRAPDNSARLLRPSVFRCRIGPDLAAV